MVNNDRKNELTRMITKMAQDEQKKGNVVGIYLNSFTEKEEKKIEIVFVVDEMTEEWEELRQEHFHQTTVTARVHNIKISPSVVHASEFSRVYMHHREAILAQELKNSFIIYDGNSEWGKEEHLLEELRESYLGDKKLPFYKNRLEISPKLIQKIRHGLRTGKRIHLFGNREGELCLSKAEESHIVNPSELTANEKLNQIRNLLLRYSIELERGLPHWDSQASGFVNQYIVCDAENFKLFQELQSKTTSSKYKLDRIFNQMKQSSITSFTEEEKTEFFSKCLSHLEKGFEKIHSMDYLNEGEKETYQKLKSMGERK